MKVIFLSEANGVISLQFLPDDADIMGVVAEY